MNEYGDKIDFYFDEVPKKGEIFQKEFRQLTCSIPTSMTLIYE
jgi:hypothetical protein